MITWGRYYWPYFIVLVSTLFLVPEIIALISNWRNTLSNYAWTELRVGPNFPVHDLAWYLSLIGWLLAVVVLSMHIWFGKFR